MKPVTVAVFNSPAEAESLQVRLAAAGIDARICRESGVDDLVDFSRPSAGVRIEVPREEFEVALQMVYDWNADSDSTSAPVIPPVAAPVFSWNQVRPRT